MLKLSMPNIFLSTATNKFNNKNYYEQVFFELRPIIRQNQINNSKNLIMRYDSEQK